MAIQRRIRFYFSTFTRTRTTVKQLNRYLTNDFHCEYIYRRYTLASKLDDLHMGDTHLIALNASPTKATTASFDQYVALIVAQHKNCFDFSALDSGNNICTSHCIQLSACIH
jgi:hypothetical protein